MPSPSATNRLCLRAIQPCLSSIITTSLKSSRHQQHVRKPTVAVVQCWGENVLSSMPSLVGTKCLFSTVAIEEDYHDDNHVISEQYLSNNRMNESDCDSNSSRHCRTCTCSSNDKQTYSTESRENTEHQLQTHKTGLLQSYQDNSMIGRQTEPEPKYSFKCRTLPSNLLAFNSAEGKTRFLQSLQSDNAEAYFPLSQQFLNQMDPAYCGVSTLTLILNALAIDPNVRWRGGWRWYGDESMLLERCCLEEERVKREGITLEQYCGLARCQGVGLVMKRPFDLTNEHNEECNNALDERYSLEEFRMDIINAVRMPPKAELDDVTDDEATTDNSAGGYFIVTSFARHALHQTGDGHFSPIAAYHPETDSCLVLDVARFKYAPYWVDVKDLYEAMIPADKASGKSRGWVLMYPPLNDANRAKRKDTKTARSNEELEGKRPAACVPLAGTGESICPVEKIKIDYCSVGTNCQVNN